MSETHAPPEAVLGIPGPWTDRSELVARMAQGNSGYLFAGHVLMQMQTGITFELQHEGRDERMLAAFRAAGPYWAGSEDMARIGTHASVAYLIGHGGSRENAEALMLAASALLDAGGLGVKVESSGIGHSPSGWRRLCADRHLLSAFNAYVLFVAGDDVYSCGMHHFGLRDVVVANDAGLQAANWSGPSPGTSSASNPISVQDRPSRCPPARRGSGSRTTPASITAKGRCSPIPGEHGDWNRPEAGGFAHSSASHATLPASGPAAPNRPESSRCRFDRRGHGLADTLGWMRSSATPGRRG